MLAGGLRPACSAFRPPIRADISATAADVDGDIGRIARRYLPEDECDPCVAAWPQLRTIVRVRPATIHAWSRGY